MSISDRCSSCRTTNVFKQCDLCQEPVCKKCLYYLAEGSFDFYRDIPEVLTHSKYCLLCYQKEVEPLEIEYKEILKKAEQTFFISKAYDGFIPIIKKSNEILIVKDKLDRDEVTMRLAFWAAQLGYNAVIYAEITRSKVRNHGYQKSIWCGQGYPALIDEERLKKDQNAQEVWRSGN